jgi:Heavy metal binding domain
LIVVPLLSIIFAALVAGGQTTVAPKPAASHGPTLPPVSYTCPMDPDIVEDTPGTCPRCRMTLEPIRLDTAYACATHTNEVQTGPGKCRIDGRQLVPVTVSLYFTCADNPGIHDLNPGVCADGRPRLAARERRAHGDHNPRHGGQFFMASDNFHHLEGTYPREGVFRVYFYDDFTRPLGRTKTAAFVARAVTREIFDPATKAYKDVETVPLTLSKDGRYFEARLPTALPAQITAKVKFKADEAEHRFDFSFPTLTTEPAPGAPAVLAPRKAAKAQFEAASPDAPRTREALLADLTAQSKDVDFSVRNGAFGQIYLSALAAKDAALELEATAGNLPEDRRVRVSAAVKKIVLSAWLLDQYGDLGDRQKIDEAYQGFAAAVAELTAAYAR